MSYKRSNYAVNSTLSKIDGLIKINKGIIWNVSVNSGNINDTINQIFKTNILHNPISHECYKIN